MPRYQSKIQHIDAIQYTGKNAKKIYRWSKGKIRYNKHRQLMIDNIDAHWPYPPIKEGMYIINLNGIFHIFDKEQFEQRYESSEGSYDDFF